MAQRRARRGDDVRPGNDEARRQPGFREQLNTYSRDCARPSLDEQAGKPFAALHASLALHGFMLSKTTAGPWLIEPAGAAA